MHSSKQKLKNLIERGSTLQKEDARATKADCAQWIQDVRTYNERMLKNHPAHKPLHDALFFFCNINSILGYLRSVYDDRGYSIHIKKQVVCTKLLYKPNTA